MIFFKVGYVYSGKININEIALLTENNVTVWKFSKF